MRIPALSLILCLTGCATSPPARVPDELFADHLFAPPAQPLDTTALFAPSDAMRAYISGPLARRVRQLGAVPGLVQALREDIRLEYDATTTKTAAEAFAARTGNCLSLVIMTAAFANELGIPARIQMVYGSDTWMREKGISVRSGHVNIVLGARGSDLRFAGTTSGPLVVDFLPTPTGVHWAGRGIGEETVVAMYGNNRAAEALLEGDAATAYWRARGAIATSPLFLPAHNTLAVVYMRTGNLPEAERVLRHVLEWEPENVEALTNLALTLSRQGRGAEADTIRLRLAEVAPHPPYHFLDLGMAALARGETDEAAKLIRKELRRMPYDDEVNLALAVVTLRLGDLEAAREHMRRAMEYSPTQERRQIYRSKLKQMQPAPR